jgi:hypothetical protein
MKATTPPKLIPPFHRTAARGTFSSEHTNEAIATIGPTIGPQSLAYRMRAEAEPLSKILGNTDSERAGQEKTASQFMTKEWLTAVFSLGAESALENGPKGLRV